jgi:hypothetical protein
MCGIGQKFGKCDNEYHIKALDYRAAVHEAQNRIDLAREDAEWLLELAPRKPEVLPQTPSLMT